MYHVQCGCVCGLVAPDELRCLIEASGGGTLLDPAMFTFDPDVRRIILVEREQVNQDPKLKSNALTV